MALIVHKNCRYDPDTTLGIAEPVVVFKRDSRGDVIPFHITVTDYVKLNGGCGVCYGRTPWGPFCRLKIYDYRVIYVKIVRDPLEIESILEERNG